MSFSNTIDSESYERLKRNSVAKKFDGTRDFEAEAQREIEYNKSKMNSPRLSKVKKVIIGLIIVIALGVGTKVAVDKIAPLVDGSYSNDAYTLGYDAIHNNTVYQKDASYYYDTGKIQALYTKDLDLNSFIYGAYKGMLTNVKDNINSVIFQLHNRGITECTNFEEFVISQGCFTIDESGKKVQDVEGWKDYSRNRIRCLNDVQKAYAQLGAYTPDQDVNEYIYYFYKLVGWNLESKEQCMDMLMEKLCEQGATPYGSFFGFAGNMGLVNENGRIDHPVLETKLQQYANNNKTIRSLKAENEKLIPANNDLSYPTSGFTK